MNLDECGQISLVETTRGNTIESIHYGSVVIAVHGKKDAISIGDSNHPYFLRSSVKPFQALAFIEHGGRDYFKLSLEEIAVLCASHSGTDAHVEVISQLQRKIGITEDMLQCGVHPPFHEKTAQRMLKNNESLHPNRHDCSGKHTGMLAFAKMVGASFDTYLDQAHPVQKHILTTFSEMCEISVDNIHIGVDGCSAPVFAVPLVNTAIAYKKLCQPDNLPLERVDACRIITSSMTEHPDMVAGPARFDTDAMRTSRGKVVTKIGAEGYHGIGVMPGFCKFFKGSIGIAIKISDGDPSLRAGPIVCLTILEKLQVLSDQELTELKDYFNRPIVNYQGAEVGNIRPASEFLDSLSNISL